MMLHTAFPTPIVVENYMPSDALLTFIKSLEPNKRFNENNRGEDHFSKMYGFHTQNIRILKEKECADLRKFILEVAMVFSNDIMCYKCSALTDTISWLSIKAPGDSHIPHTHPNSFISGVYYYEDIPEEIPLIFQKGGKNTSSFQMIPPFDHQKAAASPIANKDYVIHPKKGDLILFPSYLLHYVPVNSTGLNRGGLAINIMPKYNLGEEEHLTMFEYTDGIDQY